MNIYIYTCHFLFDDIPNPLLHSYQVMKLLTHITPPDLNVKILSITAPHPLILWCLDSEIEMIIIKIYYKAYLVLNHPL